MATPTDPGTRSATHNRYNVLFIAVDDLRPELGCYGADYAQTPHLDRLAQEGYAFLRHFTSVPTCGASRYALLTGRSPHRSGVRGGNAGLYRGRAQLSPDRQVGAQSLPELFRRSGYHTILIGKISHTPDGRVFAYDGSGDGRPELPHAWDEFATPYAEWSRGWGAFFAYADGAHREQGAGHRDLMQFTVEEDDDLPDGLMATRAIEKLQSAVHHEKPFFMGLGFFKPHLPFVAPREDWEAVQEWPVPDPDPAQTMGSNYAHKSGEFYSYNMPWPKKRPLGSRGVENSRRAYLACVRYTDRQVGRVLTALDELGLAESTVVVLWSDHGWFLGERGLWGKHTPLERALHSPLIIRAPGLSTPGRCIDALASSIDIYPTLIDLCQPRFQETHYPLDGVSLVPVMDGTSDSVRGRANSLWRKSSTVRDEQFRLIARRGASGWIDHELYEVGPESAHEVNVAGERPDVVERLEQLLE